MPRFSMNRWWTFVLALILSVASVVSIAPTVRAADGTNLYGDGNDPHTGNPAPDPQGTGDPDFPSTPGKSGKPGALRLGSPSAYNVSASGEGVNAGTSVWMIRFRVAMRMLRAYYLR